MTKLFSVKSLAFAGAAAFALTLAAAPQVDAAEPNVKATVNYRNDTLTVTPTGDDEFKVVEEAPTIYYQKAGKDGAAKEGKYTAMSAAGSATSATMNIGSLIGKEMKISISIDGKTANATTVALKAAPKVKLQYAKGTISFKDAVTDLGVNANDPITSAAVDAMIRTSAYSGWIGADDIDSVIEEAKGLGATVYVKVAKADGTTPFSKEAKVKIKAQAKAPKLAMKLDATKDFALKLKSTLEYKIDMGSTGKFSKWEAGSGSDAKWTDIIKKGIDGIDEKVVSGDAIAADFDFLVRTAAKDPKPASAINVISIKASADSPTSKAFTIKMTKQSGKTATSAALVASSDLQYSVEAGKWKKAGSGKTVKLKNDKTEIRVRIPGDKKNNVLPSGVTYVKLDFNAASGSVTANKASSGQWATNSDTGTIITN